jgi:hypothetical protein
VQSGNRAVGLIRIGLSQMSSNTVRAIGLLRRLFPSGFLAEMLQCPISAMGATCPAHLNVLDMTTNGQKAAKTYYILLGASEELFLL